MDLLADALRVAGARGSLGTRTAAGGTWGLWLDEFPGAALHAVAEGEAWLDVPGTAALKLETGDVVLLPPDTEHGLSSGPGVRMGACDAASAQQSRQRGGVVPLGSAPPTTEILTLHYQQDPEVDTPVLTALGTTMHLSAQHNPSLSGTIGLLIGELSRPGIGTIAAVNSLIDLLLVQLIRSWLDTLPADRPSSWLAAVVDPVIRDALEAIHATPEHPWTTTTLAHHIAVSRATLARRFPAALGQPPGEYLTRWRMDLAALRLRDTDDPVDTVAEAVGYSSPHAFSRAFKRLRGLAPSEYRTDARMRRREQSDRGTSHVRGSSWAAPTWHLQRLDQDVATPPPGYTM